MKISVKIERRGKGRYRAHCPNQSVLLAGVNDCPRIMRALVHKLVANRVRPYYLYQCDLSEGLSHFRTPVGKGIQIMESLIGQPQYMLL